MAEEKKPRKIILMGRSRVGKTTLLQAMHNEVIEYKKTQEIIVHDDAIDTPGEYIDQSSLWRACIIAACDADIVVLVHDAGNIGDCIEECLQTALRMQREDAEHKRKMEEMKWKIRKRKTAGHRGHNPRL